MKTTKLELEVDVIGSQDSSLTPEEENALSDFFKKKKLIKKQKKISKDRIIKRENHLIVD